DEAAQFFRPRVRQQEENDTTRA
ncbi:MAG: hypothetical protein, partial [Olavius algarvensis Gamma 3 endosymbiont]